MAPNRRTIYQNLIDEDEEQIQIFGPVNESALTADVLDPFLDKTIGVSAVNPSSRKLTLLGIADSSQVLIIQFHGNQSESRGKNRSAGTSSIPVDTTGRKLLENLLCRSHGDIYAFDLAPLALSLYLDLDLRIANGVDIQSACPIGRARDPLASIRFAMGDTADIYTDNIRDVFEQSELDDAKRTETNLAQRAWVSQHLSKLRDMEHRFGNVQRINTTQFTPEQLKFLSKISRDTQRLDQMKPTQVTHDVTSHWDSKKKRVDVKQHNFLKRMRVSDGQRVRVQVCGENGFVLPGRIARSVGKTAHVLAVGNHEGREITSITTEGRDDPTAAEAQRAAYILQILQGKIEMLDRNPWIQNIWLASGPLTWPDDFFPDSPPLEPLTAESMPRPLNESQLAAVNHMLSRSQDDCITIIQGPPGTGKTSVIAAYVDAAIREGQQGIWLVAQSNVAVKNIAEKLVDYGFLQWRLIVSKDFIFEWHEHLYNKLQNYIIRSNEFSGFSVKKQLQKCKVILCTLSMLSNARLLEMGFTQTVPINTLVVDEASQIEVGDYTPVFSTFLSTLRKICFIGDDKQLPPFGQEDNTDLQSIFEVSHLRKLALLLDTQYRMPPQLGDFISDAVYGGQLRSNRFHPVTDETVACHFVDVGLGKEQLEGHGTSWKNEPELQAVLAIAQRFQKEGRSFRIITPYEAQRAAIEDGMKARQLDAQDKVFNVDSFQGNEDDFIIISLVRSKELGFLKNVRRTNVMLTRCKKGMVICTSRAFMKKDGSKSLVGQLMNSIGEHAWVDSENIDEAEL